MRDNDSKLLIEMYSVVRENEQQQHQPNLTQQDVDKAAKELEKTFASLSDEQKEQLKQLLNSDVDLQTALAQVSGQQAQQQVAAEAYIQEGILRRTQSRLAGLGGVKDNVLGAEPGKEKRDYQNDKFSKRYDIFKKAIGSHLKELQMDLKTTKNADPTIQNKINDMATKLATSEMGGITPSTSKFQEFRHGAGRVVQGVGTAAAIATPLAILAAPLGGTLGGAVASKAAIGAITSIAKDLLNGDKPSAKNALIGAGIGGAIGAGMYGLQHMGGSGPNIPKDAGPSKPPVDTSNIDVKGPFVGPNNTVYPGVHDVGNAATQAAPHIGTHVNDNQTLIDIIKHWKPATHTQFGQMDMNGAPSGLSRADNEMAHRILDNIKKGGIDWSHLSDKGKDYYISKITGPHGRG